MLRHHPPADASSPPVQHSGRHPHLPTLRAYWLEPPGRRVESPGLLSPGGGLCHSPRRRAGPLVHHRLLVPASREDADRGGSRTVGQVPGGGCELGTPGRLHPGYARQPRRSPREKGYPPERLLLPPPGRPTGSGQPTRQMGQTTGRLRGSHRKAQLHRRTHLRKTKGRRGKAGRTTRRKVCGIPTSRFTHTMASAAYRNNMAVIAVDPAYTSIWGQRYWKQPLDRSRRQRGDGHQAAAVVIGRRSQGHSEKRRPGTHRNQPEDWRRKAAGQQTAHRTGMAPTAGNDRREHSSGARTA